MTAEKQLYALRHAKASWDEPALEDRERPLSARGRKALNLIAAYMHEHGIQPAQVLCSPARRTRETFAGLELPVEPLVEPELYGASAADLLDRLRRVPDDVPSVMIVGHNPAVQALVLKLTDGSAHGDRAEIERKFPTGALVTLSFDGGWDGLGAGRARLVAYARPKSLG